VNYQKLKKYHSCLPEVGDLQRSSSRGPGLSFSSVKPENTVTEIKRERERKRERRERERKERERREREKEKKERRERERGERERERERDFYFLIPLNLKRTFSRENYFTKPILF
jgi:hypothetical protein